MAKGRYKTLDNHVLVDYGVQTALISDEDYNHSGYTPVIEDLPTESEWFTRHPEHIPFDPPAHP